MIGDIHVPVFYAFHRFHICKSLIALSWMLSFLQLSVKTSEELEEPLGMLLFLIGRLLENEGHLLKPFLLCLAGKVGVAVARL